MNALIALNSFLASDDIPIDYSWVKPLVTAIKGVLAPILIIVAAAGSIYAIVLGVNMARAESTDKREEAKKRLVGVIIGVVAMVALILFFFFVFPMILKSFLEEPAGGWGVLGL